MNHIRTWMRCGLRGLVLLGLVGLGVAWGQQMFDRPMVVECVLLQKAYPDFLSEGLDAEGRRAVAAANDSEMKSYANVAVQPAPARLVEEIKSHLKTLETSDVPAATLKFARQNLAALDAGTCWMDFYAKRPHSFPTPERARFVAELKESNRQAANEIATGLGDDPKVFGRSARGG